MPKVSGFALPMDSLQAVAQTSGLQWVNSDPARIAAVQAAIAAEAAVVHVPRERPSHHDIRPGPPGQRTGLSTSAPRSQARVYAVGS